jgi:hypothetical protein
MAQFGNIYQLNQPLEVVCIVVELEEAHKIYLDEVCLESNNLLLTQG